MSDLEAEYGDRARFTIVSGFEHEARKRAVAEYGFGERGHGLVTFDADGRTVGILPGHDFGMPEIREKVEELLR